ncbi:hypothetical protein COMNV_01645 [Commensalibacter sp. Nvir]|uniref:hypothetical protein n=1 Tax=Commensalibacter sp. Nvir TaxID=3069817 RepID=UPI002D56BDDC|nr:hypothetical protein COMNV_01645 [Commensalibacter sp. Nvir]
MFKTKYALALTGLLLSFASFNTASYAEDLACADGASPVRAYIRSTGFSPDARSFYFTTQDTGMTYYNEVDQDNKSYINTSVQPLEITALLSHLPVKFCYSTSGSTKWVQKLELLSN